MPIDKKWEDLFTAIGLYGDKRQWSADSVIGYISQDGWQNWVTEQGAVWIDKHGSVHLIERMEKEYALNVIQFLYDSKRAYIGDPVKSPLIQALRDRVLS